MTTKTALLRAIKDNCIECAGGSLNEVKLCTVHRCKMYPYRLGKDPAPARRHTASNLQSNEKQTAGQ